MDKGTSASSAAAEVQALSLESPADAGAQVWDYASDGYVHRLIQSKTDGKLVEVPSPAPAQRDDGSGGGGATSSNTCVGSLSRCNPACQQHCATISASMDMLQGAAHPSPAYLPHPVCDCRAAPSAGKQGMTRTWRRR